VNPRHRDGVLASVVTVGMLLVARAIGVDATHLLRIGPLLVGAAGALALELLMARFPDVSRRLWSQPRVQVLAVAVVLGGGVLLSGVVGPWVFGAVLGGLATYFVLLVLVLTGVVPGPETWFRHEDRQ
jgi:hypothetical protein